MDLFMFINENNDGYLQPEEISPFIEEYGDDGGNDPDMI